MRRLRKRSQPVYFDKTIERAFEQGRKWAEEQRVDKERRLAEAKAPRVFGDEIKPGMRLQHRRYDSGNTIIVDFTVTRARVFVGHGGGSVVSLYGIADDGSFIRDCESISALWLVVE